MKTRRKTESNLQLIAEISFDTDANNRMLSGPIYTEEIASYFERWALPISKKHR